MAAEPTPPEGIDVDARSSAQILVLMRTLGDEVTEIHQDQGKILRELGANSREIENLKDGVESFKAEVNRRFDSIRPKVEGVPALVDERLKEGFDHHELESYRAGKKTRNKLMLEASKVVVAVVVTAVLGAAAAAFSFSRGYDAHRESVRVHAGTP